MKEIYPYFIQFHIIFSVIFLITILYITIHFLRGLFLRRDYGRTENRLRKIYLIMLYSDLIIGIILYFFLHKPAVAMSTEEAMRYSNLRFWAIQHFSNILFVVILCTTGNMLIKKVPVSDKKFRYSVLYFGISSVVIIISVLLFALRN